MRPGNVEAVELVSGRFRCIWRREVSDSIGIAPRKDRRISFACAQKSVYFRNFLRFRKYRGGRIRLYLPVFAAAKQLFIAVWRRRAAAFLAVFELVFEPFLCFAGSFEAFFRQYSEVFSGFQKTEGGVVLPQKQSSLRAACEHPVRFVRSFCHQIVDKYADICVLST